MDKTSTYIKTGILAFAFAVFTSGCEDSSDGYKLGSGSGGGGGSNQQTTRTLSATIKLVADIPANITYNRSTTTHNDYDYAWTVTFDVDGDGNESAGDLAMWLYYIKDDSLAEGEDVSGPINETAFYADLLESIESIDGFQYRVIGPVNVSVGTNTITLSVSMDSSEEITSIQEDTPVKFYTYEDDPSGSTPYYFDQYPDDGGFTTLIPGTEYSDSALVFNSSLLTNIESVLIEFTN